MSALSPCLDAVGVVTVVIIPFIPEPQPRPSSGLIAAVLDVRPGEQHLGGRLLVVPSRLDRRHFRRLVVNDIFTVEMPEDELGRNQHGCEIQAHAQQDRKSVV